MMAENFSQNSSFRHPEVSPKALINIRGIKGSGTVSRRRVCGRVIEHRFVAASEPPPNMGMELTVKSVTPFAKRKEQRERHFSLQLIPGC